MGILNSDISQKSDVMNIYCFLNRGRVSVLRHSHTDTQQKFTGLEIGV